MLLLEALGLHASSIAAVTGPGCRHRAWEATLLGAHFAAYLGSGVSFAPNHKVMPILTASDMTDFLRRQVLTSPNVCGGWLTDFALGGVPAPCQRVRHPGPRGEQADPRWRDAYRPTPAPDAESPHGSGSGDRPFP
jgi:hypothetical protein